MRPQIEYGTTRSGLASSGQARGEETHAERVPSRPRLDFVEFRRRTGGGHMARTESRIVWHYADSGETRIWFMDAERIVRQGTVLGENGQAALVGPPDTLKVQ